MVGTGKRLPGVPVGVLLWALAFGVSVPALGQGEPSGTPEIKAEDLRVAVPAREACRRLALQVNDVAALWEDVRAGRLDREGLRLQHETAKQSWRIRASRCVVAASEVPAGPVRDKLEAEERQIQALWAPLSAVCEAFIQGLDTEAINAKASVYADALRVYAAWVEESSAFWDQEFRDGSPRGCLDDLQKLAHQLAADIRGQVAMVPAEREPAEIERLESVRKAITRQLEQCETDPGLDTVELGLLGDTLDAYSIAISGLRSGDAKRVIEAMEAEQLITSRLARCRTEHSRGTVSAPCAGRGASP